ncbi:MAG: OprO/OprP family phosphate-selective porin [Bacteroidales bacterium]|nr:OprO/OprP family phosphate-selective porin [Bacteroidales bacterium]
MKTRIFLLSFLVSCATLSAQNHVDRLYFDMRASFYQETVDGVYSSQVVGEYLNFQMMGHVTPKISYRIRQRLNKKVFDERNMFNATDFMYVDWQATERWSFLAGKYAVLIGGYEYDAAPIDVYYYSQFCNNIYQAFTFGGMARFKIAENQLLVAQVCNSPLSLGFQNIYSYNFAWNGQIAPWWKTLWSVNFVEDMDKRMVNYVALGNHCQFGNVLFDVDLMNRSGLTQKKWFLSDYSLISKIIWSVGKWNICAKAGYEKNDAGNLDASGRAFDLVIAPGTRYLYAGCGLEWFPLGRDDLRLHAVYFRDNAEHRNNFQIGVMWRVDVIGGLSGLGRRN